MEKKNIQEETERTLNSLDGLQKAELHGFLFEKIKNRMSEQAGLKTTGFAFSWKLAAAFALVISLNAFTCWKYSRPVNIQQTSVSETGSDDTYYYNTSYSY